MKNTIEIGQLIEYLYKGKNSEYHGLGVITGIDDLNRVFFITWFHVKDANGHLPEDWRVDWHFDEYYSKNELRVLS